MLSPVERFSRSGILVAENEVGCLLGLRWVMLG